MCSSLVFSVSFFSDVSFGSISKSSGPSFREDAKRASNRWISLIIVMTGVALVGYSGSLAKDIITDFLGSTVQEAESAQLGKVLIGQSTYLALTPPMANQLMC